MYGKDATTRVRWIAKLQDMGFSLHQILEVLRGWEESKSAPDAMGRVRAMYEEKLRETREQITKLTALEGELRASLQYLGTCGTCDPVRLITACSCCEVPACPGCRDGAVGAGRGALSEYSHAGHHPRGSH